MKRLLYILMMTLLPMVAKAQNTKWKLVTICGKGIRMKYTIPVMFKPK